MGKSCCRQYTDITNYLHIVTYTSISKCFDLKRIDYLIHSNYLKYSWLKLFFSLLLQHHYAVEEVEVDAYCLCNGQGNGLECRYNDTLGDNVCQCQVGACGIDCGTCCPAYNQYPWKPGNKGPLVADPDAACQRMSQAAFIGY